MIGCGKGYLEENTVLPLMRKYLKKYENIVLVIDVNSKKVIYRISTLKSPINVQMTKYFAYVSHDEDNYITKIDLKNFISSHVYKASGTNGLILIR